MAKSKSKKGQPKPVTSPYCKPGGSKIHQQGLFATKLIPDDTEIIPYVGEKVSKTEGDRRAIDLAEEREGTGEASVYMFILDDDCDIDGNVPHNTARLINHSCDPNCEAQIIHDEIWIVSLREIKKGVELTFDYGFDLDQYDEHPCRCGSPNCVGYIVAREYWPLLKKKLAAKKKKSAAKDKKGKAVGKAAKAEKRGIKKPGSKKADGKKKPSGKKKTLKKASSSKKAGSRKVAPSKKKAKASKKVSPSTKKTKKAVKSGKKAASKSKKALGKKGAAKKAVKGKKSAKKARKKSRR